MNGGNLAWATALDRDGFVLLESVYTANEIARIGDEVAQALTKNPDEAVRRSESGHVFAARHLLSLWSGSRECWRVPILMDALAHVLGPEFGLVRGLYFDKPPEKTWSLPWHKDLTIAVRDNTLPSRQFSKPTIKVGVPHVEAPVDVLDQMLTLRIHLDTANQENGTLVVIPASHRNGKKMDSDDAGAIPVCAEAGDVLLIRPLVTHCSGSSNAETPWHRRIVHLEFAASARLPDGFEWHEFLRGALA